MKTYSMTKGGKAYYFDNIPSSVRYIDGKAFYTAYGEQPTPFVVVKTGKQLKTPTLKKRLVNYYLTCNCDRYGQINTIDAHRIVVDASEMDELRKLVELNTYGYQYGTYLGFSPWNIKCPKLLEECKKALAKNPSRNNCNNW